MAPTAAAARRLYSSMLSGFGQLHLAVCGKQPAQEREREMQVELARHGWTPPATDRISCEAHSSTFGTAPVSRLSWLTNPSKTDGNRQLKQVHSGILWVTQTGLSALHRAGAFHKTQRSVAAHHRICRRCFLETRNSKKQPLQPRQKTQSTGAACGS